jgi:uncharacterized protein YbjT (DUF2867 family)
MNILVTGANGFVGSALIERLLEEGHTVTALLRKDHGEKKSPKFKKVFGDLLRPKELPKLKSIDKAFYLVHGLKGDHEEFVFDESMAAVNFINWIRPTAADVIYLGGLGSESEKLSPHLRSRHLTGAILGASGLNVTEFRASIILGEGSASFEMIKAISERVPFRPDVSLLNQNSQPLALEDLLNYFVAAMERSPSGHEVYEVGGPDVATYGDLLDLYSELSGLHRRVLKLPEVESRVFTKALDYSIPEHSQVGKKLSESLKSPTVVTNDDAKKEFPAIKPIKLRAAMEKARVASKSHYAPIWEKDFLKTLLSDKILTQSGFLSPDLLKNIEKIGKLKDILTKR